MQLKAVAYVVRDGIFKRGAAIQEANLVEFEQGRAGFGIQALGFFLGCRHGAYGAMEARNLQPALLADKAVDRSVQVLLFKARDQFERHIGVLDNDGLLVDLAHAHDVIGKVILGNSQLGCDVRWWINNREIVDHRGHLLPAVLIRKTLGTVVFALEKRLAGKSRRILNVGTRSAPAGNKTFLGDLLDSSFDGDFGNAIELAELNDGGKLVARFKSTTSILRRISAAIASYLGIKEPPFQLD